MSQFVKIKNYIIKKDSINYVTTEHNFNNYSISIYIKGIVEPIKIEYTNSDLVNAEFSYITDLLCEE